MNQHSPFVPKDGILSNSPLNPNHPSSVAYEPKKGHGLRNTLLVAAGALSLGVFLGFLVSPSNSATEAATAASRTVTVTAPPVVTTVVPEACRMALTAADEVISTAGEAFSVVSDAMTAASELDVDGITTATGQLSTLNTDRLTPQLAAYKSARDECSGS